MSEPQRLGEFLPKAMQNIRKRCEQNPENKAFKPNFGSKHKQSVVFAVSDFFMFRRSSRPKKPRSHKAKKERIEEGKLW